MIIADASVVVEVLLRMPAADAIERRLFEPGMSRHAPHLLDVEVAHVVRKFAARGEISAERGSTALTDLSNLPLERHPHGILLPRIWALRHNLTAYDAAYVALAELLGAVLLTRDARLATAAGHSAKIEVL